MGTDITNTIRIILRYAREIDAYIKNKNYDCNTWESLGFRLCVYSLIRITIPFQEKEKEALLRDKFKSVDWKLIKAVRNACAHRSKNSFNFKQYQQVLHQEIPRVIKELSDYQKSITEFSQSAGEESSASKEPMATAPVANKSVAELSSRFTYNAVSKNESETNPAQDTE